MRNILCLSIALMFVLQGCAMMGGDEGGSTGGAPRNVDAVHLKSGDVLVGEIALEGGRLALQNDVVPKLNLEKRHLDTVRVMPDGRVKVSTKHGDVLQGRLPTGSVLLKAKTGDDVRLSLESIDRITFAE